MAIKYLKVNEIVKSISDTHSFNKEKLIAINTSDVLEGRFISSSLTPVKELKGQFKKKIKKDDILFSEIRPANKRYARVEFSDTDDYVVSTKLMVLRKFNDDVDLDYFYYWLTSEKTLKILQDRAENRICSFPQITFELLSEYSVPVPDLQTQRKIGSFLKKIDECIDINNSINNRINNTLKLIYNYWFNQFNFPDDNNNPYNFSNGKMVWNKDLKREIPENWNVSNLINNNICSVIKSGVKKFTTKNYLPTANVDGELIIDGEDVTYDNRESRANMEPIKYSVWFAKMKNSIKHISIPNNGQWFIDKYILSTGMEGIKCQDYSFPYINSVICSDYFERHKDVLSHGATQEGVNDEDLKNILFVIPPKEVLEKYSIITTPMLEKKFDILRTNKKLMDIRNSLLPQLMSGQVKLS